jgi:hypothetical protein
MCLCNYYNLLEKVALLLNGQVEVRALYLYLCLYLYEYLHVSMYVSLTAWLGI